MGNFPGDPVVKILYFHHRGTKIPQCGQKKEKSWEGGASKKSFLSPEGSQKSFSCASRCSCARWDRCLPPLQPSCNQPRNDHHTEVGITSTLKGGLARRHGVSRLWEAVPGACPPGLGSLGCCFLIFAAILTLTLCCHTLALGKRPLWEGNTQATGRVRQKRGDLKVRGNSIP